MKIHFFFLFPVLIVLSLSLKAQVLFYESFDSIPGAVATGDHSYTFPAGWTLANVDNLTPNPVDLSVSSVNNAWIRCEDFFGTAGANNKDSCAVSTSYYDPPGSADDWMWTPAITLSSGIIQLTWRGKAGAADYSDGYEVRIMGTAPTGNTGEMGNMLSSTVLYSTTAETTTWTMHTVDLSSYAGQTVYIGFRNNSNDDYLLAIDDIKVAVSHNADAAITGITGYEYTQMPVLNISSIPLSGTIKNEGVQAISQVALNARIYDASGNLVHTASGSTVESLASLASSSFTLSPAWTPDAAGAYTIKYFPSLNETDENPLNDTLTKTVTITDTTLARDNGKVTGQFSVGAPGYAGQAFTIINPSILGSVYVQYNPGTTPQQYAVSVWKTDNTGKPTVMTGGTDTLQYSGEDTLKATLPIRNGPLALAPGTYVIADIQFDNSSAVASCDDIYTENKLWYYTASGGWKNTLSSDSKKALVLRMNLHPYTKPTANALHFDGTDDRVDIPDNDAIDFADTGTYTLECWIKPSGFNALAGIISKYQTVDANGYFLRLTGDAPYTGIEFDGLKTANGILAPNTWYHIAAVNNKGIRTLYINGAPQTLSGTPVTVAANSGELALGMDYQPSPRYFNGIMDEVRIWNVARTQVQIQGNMTRSISPATPGLAAYYNMDEGTAGTGNTGLTEVTDLTANANNGTAAGFALNGNTSNWVSGYVLSDAINGNILYVDSAVTGNNSGSNWANALTSLSDALTLAGYATNIDTILVAKGTYYPEYKAGNGTEERDKAFVLPANVKILGGYPGGSSTRNITANPVILSGDINKNGIADSNDVAHVVIAAGDMGSTELNGFTITGGYGWGWANDPTFPDLASNITVNSTVINHVNGAGMVVFNAGPAFTITNCTFSKNETVRSVGGGMFIHGQSALISNCTFSENIAKYGGGMITDTSSPVISHCNFLSNSASLYGGGIYIDGTLAPTISYCTFSKDTAGGGGGIYNNISDPIVTHCTFSENMAARGGGMYNEKALPGTEISYCNFLKNEADGESQGDGGGMANVLSSPVISGCVFSENKADYSNGGGIININASSPMVVNCIFSKNSAGLGGGIYNETTSSPAIINCTFSENDAGFGVGAAVASTGSSDPVIGNSVIYGNTDDNGPYSVDASSVTTVTYSLVQQPGGAYPGEGNLNTDPLFVDAANPAGIDGIWGTADDGLILRSGSLAIDAGNNAALSADDTLDLAGNTRVIDGKVNMGAYEYFGVPLPVIISSFAGILQNSIASLQWATGVESNFNYFEVQKSAVIASSSAVISTEGRNVSSTKSNLNEGDSSTSPRSGRNDEFAPIATINAKGNNSSYTYNAPQPEPTAYYRLKMVDKDGKVMYSSIVTLSQSSNNSVLVYPNPAKDYININTGRAGRLSIYNTSGNLIQANLLQPGITSVDVHTLQPGIYFMVINGKKLQFIKK